jgi:hypothetical protein
MTQQLSTVRPGDLIRADDYNLLITAINDLVDRVVLLEAGGGSTGGVAPAIDSISPTPPRVADTVLVTGRRFDYGIGAARVTVDGLDVTLLAGSSDTVLIFQLPILAGIPDGGRPVALQVSNAQSSTTRSVLVLPQLPTPQGNVSVQFQDTQPPVITANQQALFRYRLVSGANLPVTVTLTPTVSVSAWQAGLQVLDDTASVVSSRKITVGSLLSKDFFVRVPQVTAPTTSFSLTVAAEGQGLVASSGSQTFVVGQTGAQDPDTRLSVTGVIRQGAGGDPLSGSTITLTTGEGAEVDLLLGFHRVGQFAFTASASPAASGWVVSQVPPPFVIAAGDIPATGPNAEWAMRSELFVLKAPGTAGSADLELTLQRQGAAVRRSITLHLIAQP